MKQSVPPNLSAIVAYEEWMDNKKLGKYDLNKYVLYGLVISPMLTNSTQWQDLPAQNEPGYSISDSTTTVKKEILVKKDIHSSRKIAALLSISQADGNL